MTVTLLDEDSTRAAHIPLGECVADGLRQSLEQQFESFQKYKRISFDGRYKSEHDECLVIKDYSDPDHSLAKVQDNQNGNDSVNLSSVGELRDAKALFFRIQEHDDEIFIQRFYPRMRLDKSSILSFFFDTKTFSSLKKDCFSISNHLDGIYSISSRTLAFKSISIIRAVFPGFAEEYVPGATEDEIESFFKDEIFDNDSAIKIIQKEWKCIPRLVWLLRSEQVDLRDKFKTLVEIDKKLNINCVRANRIFLSEEKKKTEIVLKALLGDVFINEGRVYLSNSKRALKPFET